MPNTLPAAAGSDSNSNNNDAATGARPMSHSHSALRPSASTHAALAPLASGSRASASQAHHVPQTAAAAAAAAASKEHSLEDSVKHLQLVNALGTNDPDAILKAIARLSATTAAASGPSTPSFGSPLHLVITLCAKPIAERVITTFCVPQGASGAPSAGATLVDHKDAGSGPQSWVNVRNSPDGETPLHIAARLGRADVVDLLFRIPSIDDTIRTASGKTAEELAKDERVIATLSKHREECCDLVLTKVRSLLSTNATQAVIDLFSSNIRARSYLALGWIDINGPIDAATDRSILHLAAKAEDMNLVNWALSHGADPNVKDKRGKKPWELCKKDRVKERLKNALAQAPIQSLNLTAQAVAPNVLAPQGVHRGPQEAPVLKGMLFKWTNYTSGYKSRYFVLENGSLSYYHDATDYPHSCRGSISTIAANVTMPDANDNSRFDIVASGNVKYSIKARSPADAKKWVWYLMESKRFMTDLRKAQMAGSLGNASLPTAASYPTTVSPRTSGTSLAAFGALAATAGSAASSTMALSTSGMALASHAAGGVAPIPAALSAPALAADKFWDPADGNDDDDDDDLQDATDDEPPVEDPLLSKVSSALSLLKLKSSDSASASTRPSTTNALPAPNGSRTSAGNRQSLSAMANAATFGPTETELTAGAASASDADAPPQRRSILLNADHVPILETMRAKSRTNVHTLLYLLDVQLEVQERVVQTLVDNLSALPPSPNAAQTTADPEYHSSLVQLPLLLQDSVQHIQQTAKRIVRLYDSREKMWGKRLHREVESRKRWEEVVSCVVGIENTAPFAAPDIRTDADEHGSSTQQRASTSESSAMYATPQPAGNASTPTWPNHSAKPYVRPTEASREGTLESPSASSFGGDSAGNSAHAHQSSFDDMDDIPDQGDDDDGEDDVFYDAHDGQTTESFIETVLGLSSMDQPRPMPTSLDLVHSPTSPVLDSSNFPSMDSLVASFSGYDPIGKARRSLPLDPSKPKPTLAVWSFLKSAIGKDISKVTLPVFFNEPLSMLQRMCEDVEYIELLSLAGRIGSKSGHPSTSASDPTDIHNDPAALAASCLQLDLNHAEGLAGEDASLLRLMLVGAFAMSNYSSTVGRSNKPFNPMLGETFELVRKDKRFRYISEQVCHHPPISACYCDSPDYTLWTEVYVKSKFWGRSLELQPLGTCHVSLPVFARDPKSGAAIVADSEHYSWKKVTTCVNNIIVGKLSIDHNGDMVIRNWRTGEECVITFKLKESGGWFGGGGSSSSRDDGGGGELVGQVKDATGRVRFELKGRWDDQLMAIPVSPPPSAMLQRPFLLWKRTPTPGNAAQNFNFTEFAMTLNEINPQLRSLLPLTDSRLRPDQTAMERGEWDLATKSKEKLELYQRNKRKEIVAHYNATGISNGPKRDVAAIDIGEAWWTPRWFVREIEPDTMEEHWRFTDEYWTLRQRAAVTNTWPEYVSDVFGLTDPDME